MEQTPGQELDSADDALILVHGTFAAADDDVGERWWQRGSSFWISIHARLGLRRPENSPSFHWSGENSEAERKQAGIRLASDYLEKLEISEKTVPPHRP